MSKKKLDEAPKVPRDIQRALDQFPKHVREKKKRWERRQKFLKETFGDLVKKLDRESKR